MKTERRHDLGTNELARWTTVWIEKIKPYSNLLLIVLIAVCGMAVVSSIWNTASESKQEEAWSAFVIAANTDDIEMAKMREVAMNDVFSGTAMQEWAFATWADRQLLLASQAYLIDRTTSLERLQQIVGVYEQLAESSGDAQLRNRARYGLAQVYELQNRLDEARSQYDQVQGDLETLARTRADHLLTTGVKESYEWLASAELPRRTFPGGPGIPGSKPAFEVDLPDASGGSLNLGGNSLEQILGGSNDGDSEDRYGTDDSSTEKENFEDLFGDEPADDETAPDESEESAEAEQATETTEPPA
jgi:hypothetical protein